MIVANDLVASSQALTVAPAQPIVLFVCDIVAVSVLTFGLYFRRHRRRELVVALLGVNVGVMAVTIALMEADPTLGLGLGLFGVLSIIRLRSSELGQAEVAYYFAALALGLLGGLQSGPAALAPALMLAPPLRSTFSVPPVTCRRVVVKLPFVSVTLRPEIAVWVCSLTV